MPEEFTSVAIEEEMRQSYMDYAMSVIIGRALPDVRDGLKPVHRRVLYAMREIGTEWNRPYKKSARIVGDVIGKYHPHGDSAVYETVVRMAQSFSLRYPLVDGQGNFGSVDGDSPAAMRYTEVRMSRLAGELLADLERGTVSFVPTYDDSSVEPEVLPTKIPNLIVNGASGIAVGMSTNIPPHNLGEIVSALLAIIAKPDISLPELMNVVPGPDFPTGATIQGIRGIEQAYESGRGIISIRSKATIEDLPSGKSRIIVTELPYQVNKARLIERMADLVNEKRIEGISDLRDESDREGMRLVVELKRDVIPDVVLNQLYKMTPLQDSFGIILLAIVDGRPKVLSLKQLLTHFLEHRRRIITRKAQHDLSKSRRRLHILEGLRCALEELDTVIRIVRGGASPNEARNELRDRLRLSNGQAQAILDMRLQRLTQLEQDSLYKEHNSLVAYISRLVTMLSNSNQVDNMIRDELSDVVTKYGDERLSAIDPYGADVAIEDLIAEEDVVVTISHAGYIKRQPTSVYQSQRRGGKGKTGTTTRDEDFVEHIFVSSSHAFLLFFTTLGRVHWVKVYEIPEGGRVSRGKAIVNLISLQKGEKVSAVLPVREFQEGNHAVFATRRGQIKKTNLMSYAKPRQGGVIAINLAPGDEVIGVSMTDGNRDILLSTSAGQSIRFSENDVRPTARNTAGVRGINLGTGDRVVSLEILEAQHSVMTVSEKGYGKRSSVAEYRVQARGGKGVATMRVTAKTGNVVGVQQVVESDNLMLITDTGRIIRLAIADLRVIGRNTQGVKVFEINGGEKVAGVALVVEDTENPSPEND